MSCLCYNYCVILMEYVINIVTKINEYEKKYTKMCILYKIFKISYFKTQRNFYSKLLQYYYVKLSNII